MNDMGISGVFRTASRLQGIDLSEIVCLSESAARLQDAWNSYTRRQTNAVNYSAALPPVQGVRFDI